MQNRVWTANRLEKRGWQNQKICPLCYNVDESALHLLAKCRLTKRIWAEMQRWTGTDLQMDNWESCHSVEQWWTLVTESPNTPRKPLRTLVILISWEIWCERNTRIFRNNASTPSSILAKIKEEGSAWGQSRGFNPAGVQNFGRYHLIPVFCLSSCGLFVSFFFHLTLYISRYVFFSALLIYSRQSFCLPYKKQYIIDFPKKKNKRISSYPHEWKRHDWISHEWWLLLSAATKI